MKLNPFKKRNNSIDAVVNEVIDMRIKKPQQTWGLINFHKKDKSVVPVAKEITSDAVKIGKIYYFADSKRLYEMLVRRGKNTYRIPVVDCYEGITVAYTPYEDVDTRMFSELFQDTISLHIEKGILDNKRKQQVNLRKALAIGLIAIVAVFIFGKTFFGG